MIEWSAILYFTLNLHSLPSVTAYRVLGTTFPLFSTSRLCQINLLAFNLTINIRILAIQTYREDHPRSNSIDCWAWLVYFSLPTTNSAFVSWTYQCHKTPFYAYRNIKAIPIKHINTYKHHSSFIRLLRAKDRPQGEMVVSSLERQKNGSSRFGGCANIREFEFLGKLGEGTFG